MERFAAFEHNSADAGCFSLVEQCTGFSILAHNNNTSRVAIPAHRRPAGRAATLNTNSRKMVRQCRWPRGWRPPSSRRCKKFAEEERS